MVRIRITGLERVERLTRAITRKIEDQNDFWPVVAELVENKVEDIFNTSGYGRWAPNSPRTLAAKSPETRILVDQGNYRDAATNRNDVGNVFQFDRNSMLYGIDISYFQGTFGSPYPLFHEQGSGVPQREVFGLIDDKPFLREVEQKAEDRIIKEIRRLT